jgi:predicted Zn-dependent peptidase
MLSGFYRYNVNNDKSENFENILNKLTVRDVQKFAANFFKKANVVNVVFMPED